MYFELSFSFLKKHLFSDAQKLGDVLCLYLCLWKINNCYMTVVKQSKPCFSNLGHIIMYYNIQDNKKQRKEIKIKNTQTM